MDDLAQFLAAYQTTIGFVGLNAMLALSVWLTLYTGQLTLGNAAFAGIAAYSSALLTMKAGLPFPLALAQLNPEWFKRRVAGVTLVSTCADGMGDVTFGLPRGLARMLNDASPSLLSALARAPKIVERGRRFGSAYAFAITRRLAFGGPVPQEFVDFTDEMLSSTPVDVLASFYPEFARLDKADVLVAGAWPPTTIICGDKDVLTPIRLSRRMAQAVPSSRLVELPEAGHLVMLERHEEVSDEIALLLKTVQAP